LNKDYDPAMHTAEHILNQTMVRVFGCGRAFSAHIEKKKSKCDYHFDRDLSVDEKQDIVHRVNEVIKNDLPVQESFLEREQAQQLFNLDRLPEHAGETVRLIKVGDYDTCPCIGTHVSRTGEIPGFSIISSSYENGVLRLRFKLKD
jgi:Ser-tRNA(Ala) deacylase AlaX